MSEEAALVIHINMLIDNLLDAQNEQQKTIGELLTLFQEYADSLRVELKNQGKRLTVAHRAKMDLLEDEHHEHAFRHKGNVVKFERKDHPFIYTSRCSFCGTHLEVRK